MCGMWIITLIDQMWFTFSVKIFLVTKMKIGENACIAEICEREMHTCTNACIHACMYVYWSSYFQYMRSNVHTHACTVYTHNTCIELFWTK